MNQAISNDDTTDIRSYFNDFMLYQRSIKNASHTLTFYKYFVTSFLDFVEANNLPKELRKITPMHIRSFFVAIQEQPHKRTGLPRKARTVHAYARAVRAFLNWSCDEAEIPNPMLKVKMPSLPGAWKVKTFSDEQIRALFDACSKTHIGQIRRNRAILAVLLDSGIRASELLNLKLSDIKQDGTFLIEHGKSKDPRTVALGAVALRELRAYLRYERPVSSSDSLFLGKGGVPMSYSGLDQLFNTLKAFAGITLQGGAHLCRHTAATTMHHNGMRGSVLQEILGHAKFQTTKQYYLDISETDVAAEHTRYSPLDNMTNLPASMHNGRGGKKSAANLPGPADLLKAVRGSTYREVARTYGVSDTTIRSRLRRAGLL